MENPQLYLKTWEPHFKQRAEFYASVPVERRTCTDIGCLLFFIFMLLTFLILAVWSSIQWKIPHTVYFMLVCIGMYILSLIVSITFVCFTRCLPKCMIYFSIVQTIAFLIGIIVLVFYLSKIALGVIVIIALIIFLIIFFCCWRQKIDTTILLLKITRKFLSENSVLYWTALLISFIYLIILTILVTHNFSSHFAFYAGDISFAVHAISTVLAGIFFIFFIYYFYYLMVFLISSAVSVWFFRGRSECCVGFGWSFYHIGTLTYASVMITLVKIISMLISTTQPGTNNVNCCAKFCTSCLQTCLSQCISCFQGLIQTLNHNAIIITALTGEDYLTSAKSAIVLLCSNYDLFSDINSVSRFLFYLGLLFSVGTSTFLSILIIRFGTFATNSGVSIEVIAIFISLMISQILIITISESMNAIFLYYILEEKVIEYGQKHPYQSQIISQDDIKNETYLNSIDSRALIRGVISLMAPSMQKPVPFESIQ